MIQTDSSEFLKVAMPGVYDAKGLDLWPSADAFRRRVVYARNLKLYQGEHTEVFKGLPAEMTLSALANWSPATEEEQRWRDAAYMTVNLLARYNHQQADLLCQEAPVWAFGEDQSAAQAAGDRIIRDSALALTLYQLATTALPCKGDAVLKLHIEADGTARITAVPSENVEWERDPLDAQNYTAATVNTLMCGADGTRYLWRERHEAGRVTNSAHSVKCVDETHGIHQVTGEVPLSVLFPPAKEGEEQSIRKEYATGLDVPTLYKLPNRLMDGCFDGVSDYTTDVIQLQRAIMALLSDWYKYVVQKVYGGIVVLSTRAEGAIRSGIVTASSGSDVRAAASSSSGRRQRAPTISRSSLEVQIEDSETNGITRHVGIDGNFTSQENQWKTLVRSLAFVLGLDISGLFDGEGGAPASGRALRLRMAPTLAVVKRKIVFLKISLEQIVFDAQRFEQAHRESEIARGVSPSRLPPAYEPARPSVTFRDGLPRDPQEEAQVDEIELRNQTISRRGAIMRRDGCTLAQAQKVLDMIIEEEAMMGAAKADAFARGSGVMRRPAPVEEGDEPEEPEEEAPEAARRVETDDADTDAPAADGAA